MGKMGRTEPRQKRRRRFSAIRAGDYTGGKHNHFDRESTSPQVIARHEMANALKLGIVRTPPLVCEHCLSPSIIDDVDRPHMFDCVTCGRATAKIQAHIRRTQRISEMILNAGMVDDA